MIVIAHNISVASNGVYIANIYPDTDATSIFAIKQAENIIFSLNSGKLSFTTKDNNNPFVCYMQLES